MKPRRTISPSMAVSLLALFIALGGTATAVNSLRGATGPRGPRGARGAQGPEGQHGELGLQGPRGPQGQDGPTGSQGPASTQMGPTGPAGLKGEQGPTGAPYPLFQGAWCSVCIYHAGVIVVYQNKWFYDGANNPKVGAPPTGGEWSVVLEP